MDLCVSLGDFCYYYNISGSDRDKLELLEYRPGDNAVLTLSSDDWKEVKFTTLGWKGFILAHKRFVRDAKDGVWDNF